MITLQELSQLSSNNIEEQFNADWKKSTLEERKKYEKEYQDAITNLSNKLKKAAIELKREYTVIKFEAYRSGIFRITSERFNRTASRSGNLYCAFRDKKVTQSDVIENMTGNLKRIYNFLNENHLNPIIEYWTDGGGMTEGLKIVIRW